MAEEADADGFIETLNVLLGPDNGEGLVQIETGAVAYLEQVVGATNVQARPRVIVAGHPSVHLSAQLTSSGISYRTEQYLLFSAGVAYTVTFSFGESAPQQGREALAESVLATWTWD